MGIIVGFSYQNWAVLYPQLAAQINETQANAFFAMAQIWLRNDGCGPICNPAIKIQLFNLLVAHLAQLQLQAQRANGAPGRIANASMGSVSIGLNYPDQPNAAWYTQTSYGASYWDAIKPYRLMYYLPGPVRAVDPWFSWLSQHRWYSHGAGCDCGCCGKGVWVDDISIIGNSRDTPLSANIIDGGVYGPPPPEPEEECDDTGKLLAIIRWLLKDKKKTHEILKRIEAGDFTPDEKKLGLHHLLEHIDLDDLLKLFEQCAAEKERPRPPKPKPPPPPDPLPDPSVVPPITATAPVILKHQVYDDDDKSHLPPWQR